jgi:hypothetical protein
LRDGAGIRNESRTRAAGIVRGGRQCRRAIPPFAFAAIFLLIPATARAERSLEITPFAGYAIGGGFEDNTTGASLDVPSTGIAGLILGLRDTDESQYELFYGFQRTELRSGGISGGLPLFDMDIHYLHLGGTYLFPREKVRPFVSGGLGLTLLAPDASGASSKAYFSLSLGGGAKIPISNRFGLRFEGRGFLTILPDDTEIFCVSSGGAACTVNVKGDVFGQIQLLAGVYFGI